MKVIGVIEDENVIKKIFKHLGLWDRKARSPTKATGPPKPLKYTFDYSTCQLPASDKWIAEGHVFSMIAVEYPEFYQS